VISTFGPVDRASLAQLERCMTDDAVGGVLCADHHRGYAHPIGGVIAYAEHVSPTGVGFDIGCGNKAVLTDARAEDLDVARAMDEIARRVSFGLGRVAGEPADHPVLDEIRAAGVPFQRGLLDLAASQLGTVGGGNHYVDLLRDEAGRLWVGVHFGSRGFGHRTARHYMRDGPMDGPPTLLPADSAQGREYVEAMELAGRYAHAGRGVVVDKVLEILGVRVLHSVHNHHNFAWRERHRGVDCWVVRKGATPAYPGQEGFVGGSMGDISAILAGVESEASKDALRSTIHGAGRRMSRTEAKGKVHRRTGRVIRPARIDWRAARGELVGRGIEVRGGDADEAPAAYKRLSEVLGHHEGTIEVRHVLEPIGVAMAGPGVVDPFRD